MPKYTNNAKDTTERASQI